MATGLTDCFCLAKMLSLSAKSMAAAFEDVFVESSLSEVTYFHLVFDRHEVIFAEGAATESFHPGEEGVLNLSSEARTELFTLWNQP
jgi:hypothetical protein